MVTVTEIQSAVTTALKSGDRTRADALRLLVNEVKKIAKDDKNREPTADDVITGANRLVKRANETMSFLSEGDLRGIALHAEIQIISEFLPQRMTDGALAKLIESLMADAPEGKAARGHVMKELNSKYRGQFDNKSANDILTGLATS